MTVRTTQQPSATSCRHVSYLCYDCTGSTLASAISKHTNHPTHHPSTHHIHHLSHCSERNRILVHYLSFPVKMTPAKMAPVSANPLAEPAHGATQAPAAGTEGAPNPQRHQQPARAGRRLALDASGRLLVAGRRRQRSSSSRPAKPEDRGVINSLCSQPFLGQRGSTKQETRTAHVEHSHRPCNPNEWSDGRRAQRYDLEDRSLHLTVCLGTTHGGLFSECSVVPHAQSREPALQSQRVVGWKESSTL
jgi:hypothetical protein